MNKSITEKLAVATILALFVTFVLLLVFGAIFKSLPMIIVAFVCGFVGYAISQNESEVEYNKTTEEGI